MTDNEVVKALEVCAYSDACLKECPFFNYKADCTKRLTASALEIIKRHQSDVVPVRHGEWANEETAVTCTACGRSYDTDFEVKRNVILDFNYCPHCGAMMAIMDGDPYA